MDNIKHFILPNQSNELYKNEAVNSISLTKLVAEKINELVNAYNTLSKSEIEEYQAINGQMNALKLYVKDNLINTLQDMFDTLEDAGEISDMVENMLPDILANNFTYVALAGESINGVNYVTDVRYPYGHVKRYGAFNDGISDNSSLFNRIGIICSVNGFPIICDSGRYYCGSAVDWRNVKRIEFNGTLVCANSVYIKCGSNSTDGNGIKVSIDKVDNIEFTGIKNSEINIRYSNNIKLFADGDDPSTNSIGYCTFNGSRCKKVTIYSSGTNIGWINENVFNIKRIEEVEIGGNYDHNNNHFEHCNMERGIITLNNARNNYFSARGEGGISIDSEYANDSNFVEQEYYFKHYFGNGIIEQNNGNITSYPVNKLQNESEFFRIDSANKDHPIGKVFFEADGTFKPLSYGEIFKSKLIPITGSFAIKTYSDVPCFRVRMNFYNSNKERIIERVSCFADGRMAYDGSGTWSYYVSVNSKDDIINIWKDSSASFVEFSIYFGNNLDEMNIEYIAASIVKYVGNTTHLDNTISYNVYTQVPSNGYWEKGTKLYAAHPNAGQYIGIICIESGSPGTWKNFGSIQA